MTTLPTIGSKVQLISGGPIMTVAGTNAISVVLVWFTTTYELQSGEFPIATLKLIP